MGTRSERSSVVGAGAGEVLDAFGMAFKALTGYQPFRWQRRLFDLMDSGKLPSAVDVPTGLGKTSVMTLWLIALGRGAALPRRLVYVVDRRAVVDQATRSAQQLRESVPPDIAGDLGLGAEGLPISTLRGGAADNRAWLDDPSRPAIVVGTVDMVGSRLLFEGYGVSKGMRPYQAGFLGADTLLVLDEAHLCPPFEALLRDIERQRDSKFGPVGKLAQKDAFTPPFRLVSLSATGRSGEGRRAAFRLQREDREEAEVHQRLSAAKSLALHSIDDPKALPKEMAERAIRLGFGDVPKRVVVYCDRRSDALAVKKAIDQAIKAKAAPAKTELLVGARRVRERERLESWLDEAGLLGGGQAQPEVPVFLVATSAGEVGVDMDADHMVGDLVAFERMVQRLGRVNRRGGQNRDAVVEVICPRPQEKVKAKQEAAIALHEARERVFRALPNDTQGRYEASPQAFVDLKAQHPSLAEDATTTPPLHPPLTRPHLEAWAMTSLATHEGRTEVEPWLRGWEADEKPQVEVVWRAHLPQRRVGDDVAAPADMVAAYFQAAPVHPTEKLETLRSHVEDWLLKRVRNLVQAQKKAPADDAPKPAEIIAMVINRAGGLVDKATLEDLEFLAERATTLDKTDKRAQYRRKEEWQRNLAGGLLVLDRRIGGLDADGMLDEKCAAPVPAIDDDDVWLDVDDDPSAAPRVTFRVMQTGAQTDGDGTPEGLDDARWLLTRHFETRLDQAGEVVAGLAVYKWADSATDEDSRSVQTHAQRLDEHADQVAAQARRIAERLRLPPAEVDAMECAARLHDDGKAAQRWQEAMGAPRCGGPYAKTKGGGNWRLLEGYRHEFGSLRKAEKMSLPSEARDLILHLIAAHHGNARPVIATAGCDEAPPTVLATTARDAALRYARLQKRYGIWGLAWREAVLRAADQTASRQFAESKRSNDG